MHPLTSLKMFLDYSGGDFRGSVLYIWHICQQNMEC